MGGWGYLWLFGLFDWSVPVVSAGMETRPVVALGLGRPLWGLLFVGSEQSIHGHCCSLSSSRILTSRRAVAVW